MSKRPAYIPDGYTEKVFIDSGNPNYEPLRATIRPMLPEDSAKVIMASAEGEDRYFPLAVELVLPHVKEWDLVEYKINAAGEYVSTGKPLPVTAAAMRRLRRRMLARLIDVVAGFVVSDIDPLWSDAKKSETAQRMKPIAELPPLETDAKNSEPA